jgi:hypothetical protein
VAVNINTKRNSVQLKIKQSTAVAATPVRIVGSMILRKICQYVAPSIRAASSISLGTSSKKTFEKQHGQGNIHHAMGQNDS